MKTFLGASLVVASSLFSLAASAEPAPPPHTTTVGSDSDTDNNAYVGASWTLGGSLVPELVIGLMHTQVHSDGETRGANLSLNLNLSQGIQPGALKLTYLNGDEETQGEIGAGYNFMNAAPLLVFGVNGPYVGAGVDAYGFDDLRPFGLLKSQGELDEPEQVEVQWGDA